MPTVNMAGLTRKQTEAVMHWMSLETEARAATRRAWYAEIQARRFLTELGGANQASATAREAAANLIPDFEDRIVVRERKE